MVNLKEYIHPEMDILFLALNAPEVSNANEHWFSRNLSFWNLLYRTGLIILQVTLPTEGDTVVFGSNKINTEGMVYGVTDLNNEVVKTDSREVSIERRHVQRVLEILQTNSVAKLCLMHSKVGKAFRDSGFLKNSTGNRYGLIGYLGTTAAYEVPFHNAPVANKELYYGKLIGTPKAKAFYQAEKEKPKSPVSFQIKSPTPKSSSTFTIPKNGNEITKKDIEKGVLRIAADFKEFFPQRDAFVKVIAGSTTKNISYQLKEGRSSLLKLGKDLMNKLNIKHGNRLQFLKLQDGSYEIKKL